MKRVFILSSHPILGKGIESLLQWEEGLTIVGHEIDPDRAMEQIKALQPDVVIVDCSDAEAARALTVMRPFKQGTRPCVIGLDLSENTISIYHGEQRPIQDVDDLIAAVQNHVAPADSARAGGADE